MSMGHNGRLLSEDIIVLLDTASYPSFLDGRTNPRYNYPIQRIRKKASLVPTDDIHPGYINVSNPDDVDVHAVVSSR